MAPLCQVKLPLIKEMQQKKWELASFGRTSSLLLSQREWIGILTLIIQVITESQNIEVPRQAGAALRQKLPAARKLPNIPIGWTTNKSLHSFSQWICWNLFS